MTVYVKVGKFFDVFQNGFKIFQIGFLIGSTFKKVGIIGVLTVADMGGAYYKVKIKGDPEIAQKLSAARKELALKYIENNPEFDHDAFEKTFEDDLIRCIGCDRRRAEESARNTKPIVECPYCHSKNTSKISSLSKAVSIAAFGLFSQKRKYQWHCNNCRSDF